MGVLAIVLVDVHVPALAPQVCGETQAEQGNSAANEAEYEVAGHQTPPFGTQKHGALPAGLMIGSVAPLVYRHQ